MRDRWEEITGAGATVVAIGMGQVEMAAHFREGQDIPFPLIVDRKKETYRALEVGRGTLLSVAGPTVWVQAVKNITKGHPPFKKPQQDALQLGGTAIVKPGGEIAHIHRSKDSSDNYPVDEVIEKVRAL